MSCISCNSSFSNQQFKIGNHFKCSEFFNYKFPLKCAKKYKLNLVFCKRCNLIQFKNPINYLNLLPKFKWMVNKEEDKYHPDFVKILLKKKILSKKFEILGISNYDKKLLSSLENYGYRKTKLLNLKNHLNIKTRFNYRQEIIQKNLSENSAKVFLKRNKKVDLIVCSKLIEHTQNIRQVFSFFKKILKKNGLIIIDVPDSKKSLVQGNISMIWEEHISYFTNKSLHNTLVINGFKKILSKTFFFKQENNLVFFYKKNEVKSYPNKLLKEKNLIMKFKIKVKNYKKRIENILQTFKERKYFNVVYGAGHNSVAFINYLKLGKYFSYIVDDDENKKNLKLYGSNLEVKNFDYIKKISKKFVFFLGINIYIESKVTPKLKQLKDSKVFSLYPDSKLFFK